MSDAGGTTAVTGVNLTLIDSAALAIPDVLVSGTFKPTNIGAGDAFAGAPPATGGSPLGVFDGTDPNGAWNLYVVDDFPRTASGKVQKFRLRQQVRDGDLTPGGSDTR